MKMIATITLAHVVAERKATEGRRNSILAAHGLPTPGALHPAVPRPPGGELFEVWWT